MKALSFDAYTLKWVAIVGMITNHVAIGLAPFIHILPLFVLYTLGGLTYVIMSFFVVEGYKHTSNLKKYIGRLLLFGVIAQAFHPTVLGATDIAGGGILLNILFAIALSLLVLLAYDKIKIRPLFWLLFVVALGLSLFMDLPIVSVVVPLLYYTIKKENLRRLLPVILSGVFWAVLGGLVALTPILYLTTGMFAQEMHATAELAGLTIELMAVMPGFALGCFAGAILLRNYNGQRGRRSKWLFYVAYPAHLAIIAAAMLGLGLASFNLFVL